MFYATLVYVAVLVISLTACGGTDEFSSGPQNSLNTAGAAGEPAAIPDAGRLGTGGSAPTAGASGSPSTAGAAGDSGTSAGTAGKATGGSAPSFGGSVPSTGGSGGGTATGGNSPTGGSGTGGSVSSTGGSGTGGLTPSTGGSSPGTGGSGTGGLAPSTGGSGTGGSVPATGGQGTGGTTPSTGGSGTGGLAPSTGGRGTGGTGTGGLTPSTGGTGTGGVSPSTGGTGTGGTTPSTGGTGTGGLGTGGAPTCTADLNTDPHNCGSCGYACNIPTETCQAGTCTTLVCGSGTGNCDGNAQNGCETNTTTTDNCGACGVRCTAEAGMTATCSGTCQYACLPGLADCNGTLSDGCELTVSSNPTNCGTCGHSCFGGTCTNGTCQFAVEEIHNEGASKQENIQQLAVDEANVYWTTGSTIYGLFLRKTPKAGGAATTLATGSLPYGLVIKGSFVYWSDGAGGPSTHQIKKTPTAGGATITLASDTSYAHFLAVDGSYVYWLNSERPDLNIPATVYSVPVGGGATQTVLSLTDSGSIAQQFASGDTGNLCFAIGPYSPTNSLPSLNVACVGWSINNPSHAQVFGRDTFDANHGKQQIAYTSGHPYWYNGSHYFAQGTAGSAPTTFLTGVNEEALVGDSTSLLWFGSAPTVTGGYAVCQIPLSGGTVKQLSPYSTDNVIAMASDGAYVYWTNGTYIRRAPKL